MMMINQIEISNQLSFIFCCFLVRKTRSNNALGYIIPTVFFNSSANSAIFCITCSASPTLRRRPACYTGILLSVWKLKRVHRVFFLTIRQPHQLLVSLLMGTIWHSFFSQTKIRKSFLFSLIVFVLICASGYSILRFTMRAYLRPLSAVRASCDRTCS